MPVLVFEPDGNGPHPGFLIAQILPVAHAGLERDPFQVKMGERYAAASSYRSQIAHRQPS